jgi:hypothetical protein
MPEKSTVSVTPNAKFQPKSTPYQINTSHSIASFSMGRFLLYSTLLGGMSMFMCTQLYGNQSDNNLDNSKPDNNSMSFEYLWNVLKESLSNLLPMAFAETINTNTVTTESNSAGDDMADDINIAAANAFELIPQHHVPL